MGSGARHAALVGNRLEDLQRIQVQVSHFENSLS
jgi:hypothetical protein